MKIGLRIDVDTFRGTKIGVPNLCRQLAAHKINATFFFSVGPDNMGRHLWRLLKPAFLIKMLRSNAPGLYGWDILFKGTFWPGPLIGKNLESVIKRTADDGHEIGLHAWDHQQWQAKIDSLSSDAIYTSLKKGVDELTRIVGAAPVCSAVPGWKCENKTLEEKEKFGFQFNSDCRGYSSFLPAVEGKTLETPQIPVTLPTYDEVVGRDGIDNSNYNDHILSLVQKDILNVLTIHAEVEGILCHDMFEEFIVKAKEKGMEFVPLGTLLNSSEALPKLNVVPKAFPGREGWIACQEEPSA